MSATVHIGGRRVRLADKDLLGVGGEGEVYRWRDRAIKVFFTADRARQDKLAAFPRDLPASVIGPTELCTDDAGAVIGFAMRALEGATDAHRLGQRKWREAQASPPDVLALFRELGGAVSELHARGIVVGDLNDGNVVLTCPPAGRSRGRWTPFLIDADSMQLPGFPCVVAHERFLDPRLYGVDLAARAALSRETDFYALAVMLFTSLLYVHPFGGAHASYPTMLRRAEARHSVLRGDVKLPHAALPPAVLPDDALAWFLAVFERDHRAPLPPALLDARLSRCASCGATHARRTCPVCTVRAPVPEPIVTRGRLRATRLPRLPDHALASPGAPLVALDGEWLVRPGDGTRVGQILEGQTHVRAGAEVGFAFYRAGAVTVCFVFDPRRGPLRQIDLPPLEGRLVDWSAVFDAGHVLFSTVTEKAGKATHAAHLVAATGEVLASESGPPGASAILGSANGASGAAGDGISGRCLAGGSVLVATGDGLVLVRADRSSRAFTPARAFPETRDLVPPDADLLVGPGGSVYVVSHDVVVHLCFEGQTRP